LEIFPKRAPGNPALGLARCPGSWIDSVAEFGSNFRCFPGCELPSSKQTLRRTEPIYSVSPDRASGSLPDTGLSPTKNRYSWTKFLEVGRGKWNVLRFLRINAANLERPHYGIRTRLITDIVLIGISFAVASLLHLLAAKARTRIPTEDDIRVSLESKNIAGTEIQESDDPIQTWSEDALSRTSLIDSLTIKLLISKAPVIALFGEFGSGKTSILNLLPALVSPGPSSRLLPGLRSPAARQRRSQFATKLADSRDTKSGA
jgi:hypothetical protein